MRRNAPAAIEAMPTGTTDRVLDGRVIVTQPNDGYRVAIDPIFMAAAVEIEPGARVLDLGCGVGTASLCLAARVADAAIVGLDCEPVFIAFATANASGNACGDRVRFLLGDLLIPPAELPIAGFDHVMANPPYLKRGTATVSAHPLKAAATMEGAAALQDWVDAAARCLKPGGGLTMIHRADRLADLIAALAPAFGDLRILPLLPKTGVAAKRVILRAMLGGGGKAVELPGFVLHEPDGRFTAAADKVLRGGAALR
jgi:tRNA1(Val) A37 N6-methylase TrmN6